jgi:hypothetical protein
VTLGLSHCEDNITTYVEGSENEVLRRIFESKREKLTERWRKLYF